MRREDNTLPVMFCDLSGDQLFGFSKLCKSCLTCSGTCPIRVSFNHKRLNSIYSPLPHALSLNPSTKSVFCSAYRRRKEKETTEADSRVSAVRRRMERKGQLKLF